MKIQLSLPLVSFQSISRFRMTEKFTDRGDKSKIIAITTRWITARAPMIIH